MQNLKQSVIIFIITSIVSALVISAIYYNYVGSLEYPHVIVQEVWLRVKTKNWSGIKPQVFIYTFGALAFPVLITFMSVSFVKGDYGNARWANYFTIKKMKLFASSGMVLGYIHIFPLVRKYLRFEESLSIAVSAPPGVGKTTSIAVPNLIISRESQIVLDIKGELWELTSAYREKFSKVYRFSPAHTDSCNWNPLHKDMLPKEWPYIVQYVERIAFVLIPTPTSSSGNENTNHFIGEGRSLFIFFTLYLINKYGETSLPDIRKFALSISDIETWLLDIQKNADSFPDRIVEEANSLAQKTDREFSGVFSTFKEKMNVFADEITADNLRNNDFTFKQFRQTNSTLYLTVQLRDMDRYAPLLRLMFELSAYEFQAEEPKPEEFGIHYLADEFVRLKKMEQLIKIPELGRSFKLRGTYIFQSLAQVEEVYGKTGVKNLMNTTFAKVIFQQNDADTAKEICNDIIGKETRIKKGANRSNRGLETATVSQSENAEGQNLILPQELLSLDENEIIIIVRGFAETPIKARPLSWFKDKRLKQIINQSKRKISWQ